MKKILYSLALLSFSIASAQVNEKVLADTVEFITFKVKALESLNYDQNIYRLNYDDCNLEYERLYKGEEDKWFIYDFWLADVDEEKMSLEFDEGGWKMTLFTVGDKVEFDSNGGSGWSSKVEMYSADQAPLIEVGRALYYSIKNCKELPRFKK